MKWSDWMSNCRRTTTVLLAVKRWTRIIKLKQTNYALFSCVGLRRMSLSPRFTLIFSLPRYFLLLRFYVRTMYVLLTSVHTPSSTKTHQQRQQRQQRQPTSSSIIVAVIESTGIQYYLERVITTGSRCHH